MNEQEQRELFRSLGSIEAKLDSLANERVKRDDHVDARLRKIELRVGHHEKVIYAGGAIMAVFLTFKDVIFLALNLNT